MEGKTERVFLVLYRSLICTVGMALVIRLPALEVYLSSVQLQAEKNPLHIMAEK